MNDRDLTIENLEARLRAMGMAIRLFCDKYRKMKKLFKKEQSRAANYKYLYEQLKHKEHWK